MLLSQFPVKYLGGKRESSCGSCRVFAVVIVLNYLKGNIMGLVTTWAGAIFVCCAIHFASCSEEVEQILNSTFYSYDKNIRPHFSRGPVHVGVTVHVLSISKVDTSNQTDNYDELEHLMSRTKQEFTVDLYFRQTWSDPRLTFQPRPGVSNVTLETDYLRRIWVPDTFFVNEVTSSFHSNTVSNELVRLKANGEVMKSMRLTITAVCPMKLNNFPFDHPVCSLQIESFSSSVKEIVYEWIGAPSSVTIGQDAAIGDFRVVGYRIDSAEIMSLPPVSAKYSRLTLDIQLRRIVGRYHTEYFSPCFLLVTVALLGLWIRNPQISMGLAVAMFIAIELLAGLSCALIKLPRWADHSWLDSYTHFCISFVLLVMIVSLVELNIPDYEEPEIDQDEQIQLKVDSKKETRSSSSVSEDAKLVRPRTRSETDQPDSTDGQSLDEIKEKLLHVIRLSHRYYFMAEPYAKWVLLFGFFLANWIFWKITPSLHPIHNLVQV